MMKLTMNETQKTLEMIYNCQRDYALLLSKDKNIEIKDLKERLVSSLENELELNE